MTNAPNDFEREANTPAPGFFRELVDFIRENKKWWLTPIIAVLLLIGVLIVLGSTAAGPFIYALF
jgi:hypothetical protein